MKNNLKNLTEKQTLTITIISAVLVCLIPLCVLGYFQYEAGTGFTSTLLDNPENLTSKLEGLQSQISIMDIKIKTRNRLEEEKDGLNEIYLRAKKALPEKEHLEGLMKLLGDVLDKTKVKLVHWKNITPKKAPVRRKTKSKKKAGAPLKFVQIKYTIEGNYQEILSFMHQVEDHNFERFVMVTELKLDPKMDPNNSDNLEYMKADIVFASFFYLVEEKKKVKKGGAK